MAAERPLALLRLDIGLADDATVVGRLPAEIGRKLRAASPDRIQALLDELGLGRGDLHGRNEPAGELRDDALWRFRRGEHPEPNLVLELLVARRGRGWQVRQRV